MKHIRNVSLCLAILGVGLPASADIKSLHGASCQPEAHIWSDNVSYSAVDGVTSVGGTHVVCPIPRDRINSATSLTGVTLEVYIPSSGSINCTLYSQTEDGSAGSTVDSDSVSRTTPGVGSMSFNVSSTNGNEGTYGLFCDMSDGSKIYHIYVDENNAATD